MCCRWQLWLPVICGYGFLYQPLFFSTPIELGGLGMMSPSTIGKILSIYGILNGTFQILLFAKIHDLWGSEKVFRVGIASVFPAVAVFPVMSYLVKTPGLTFTVCFVIIFQMVHGCQPIIWYALSC